MTPSSETVPRYPLEWPLGWKRTPSYARKNATFKHEKRSLNTEMATNRLEEQLERLGATQAVLSTNVSLNLRGIPRGDERPADPGVAVYFLFKKKPTVLACDTYSTVADNIAAIAAHVEALRRIERYGVGTIEQAMAGYKSLPADTAADWRMVLFGVKDWRGNREDVKRAYLERARQLHPDVGGSDAEMAHLNRARDYALEEVTS